MKMKAINNSKLRPWGFHFYLTIGKLDRPKIKYMTSMRGIRVCLGWIALQAGLVDIEGKWKRYLEAIHEILDKNDELKKMDAVKTLSELNK